MAFFSKKMITTKTRNETYDRELLTIVEVFKTWHHYLKGCKHNLLILIDYNNHHWFVDTKSFSFKLVRWALELSQYYFQIDYCQGKANEVADALF